MSSHRCAQALHHHPRLLAQILEKIHHHLHVCAWHPASVHLLYDAVWVAGLMMLNPIITKNLNKFLVIHC